MFAFCTVQCSCIVIHEKMRKASGKGEVMTLYERL